MVHNQASDAIGHIRDCCHCPTQLYGAHPRKLTVTTDEINIHLLAWKINIPADEIVKVEHYPHGIQSSRIAGAGGFFGNLGLFTCKECGKHLSLITDPIDVCIITRKSKMPIVVSIENYSVFNTILEVQEKN